MTTLPSLELKYKSERRNSLISANTNTNTINNNIILTPTNTQDNNHSSTKSIERIDTPTNIRLFKDAFMDILISYFKNNIILLNNLIELSEKIIMKVSDLTLLISLLLQIDKSAVYIDVEEISTTNCCGKVCNKLPRYRKINDIIINNKQSFKVSFNQYYIQMNLEFNISLDFLLL
jgi:hypothetical protein